MDDVEIWRTRKLLRDLKAARGNGTSMISLVIPPKDSLTRIYKMLSDEYATASNIKSRVNRLSVLTAITQAQSKLKCYKNTPTNGLGIFAGTIVVGDTEKKIVVGVEPHRPVNTSLYLCDSKFHVDDLLKLFESDSKYGFVVIDGHECLLALLYGDCKTVLQRFTVDLPKKHGRGGQSSVRFARLRIEKRILYAKKAAEACTQAFLTDVLPNINGLILAGNADLKHDMAGYLDYRLKPLVLKTIDTNYGGEAGLSEAISLSTDVLKEVSFAAEKALLQKLFEEVRTSSGKYALGLKATFKCLEMCAVETLIVWEGLNDMHGDVKFLDWIAESYKDFSTTLHVISGNSEEGHQFIHGFGGVGAILRYKVEEIDENEDDYSDISDDEIF